MSDIEDQVKDTHLQHMMVERHQVHIRVDEGDMTYNDRLWATWEPPFDPDGMGPHWGGYWTICGDNTGSQALVVHPYMVPALRELLAQLPDKTVGLTEDN